MNRLVYAKLKDGVLEYAPKTLGLVANPTPEMYLAAGWIIFFISLFSFFTVSFLNYWFMIEFFEMSIVTIVISCINENTNSNKY